MHVDDRLGVGPQDRTCRVANQLCVCKQARFIPCRFDRYLVRPDAKLGDRPNDGLRATYCQRVRAYMKHFYHPLALITCRPLGSYFSYHAHRESSIS